MPPPGSTAPAPPPEFTIPAPPPDYTNPMPPSEETSTRLSPEPWAEPAIWRPPAPPKRSKAPYLLVAGVVLLVVVALGIVFWPSGSDPSAGSGGGGGASTRQSPNVVPESEPADTQAADAQARAVDVLLADMATTRSDLGTVVVGGCERSGLQRVLDARTSQLEKARALKVDALTGGTQMQEALIRALEASAESNQRYLDVAPGCPPESEVIGVNQRASDAKNEFIGYWSPIARQAGLVERTADDI
ncbi:hypothetical protein [Actinomadura spongiicola]|nr:hypothetical protein [Actinomadura spongiicola]